MSPSKLPVILYFVHGVVVDAKAKLEASMIGGNVKFRNADKVSEEHTLEKCDGVAGEVPNSYKVLPTAQVAIAKHRAELERLNKLVGDEPAPVLSKGLKTPEPETDELNEKAPKATNKPAPTWK